MIFPEWFITLVVGVISSFFGACIGSIFSQHKERRDSYRRLLEQYISDLGNRCYQSVAIAKTLNERIKNNQSRSSWLAKHRQNRVELEQIRLSLRYPLWGCDEGIRCLIRLPTWVCLCYKDKQTCNSLIKSGNNLRKCIDRAVIDVLRSGDKPSYFYTIQIAYYVKKINKIYSMYMSKKLSSLGI